jgi:succinate dehydrogenase / fumarate reductase flavoprotein subunit
LEYAAEYAKEQMQGEINQSQIERMGRQTLEAFERTGGENPFQIQHDLQDMMQDLVGIVRTEDEMQQALIGIKELKERREKISLTGNIDFNPSWHTALDLHNLLTVSEAITRAAIERKESRGGQYREDYPAKDAEFGKVNFTIKKDTDGEMKIERVPILEMPAELKQIIEEMG